MYGVILVLTLIFLGGAIAYIGDNLGRKVGRKRVSLFGLRPRYTSILMTICTGIFISTVSLGILSAVSQDVRTALFGMKQLQATLASTRRLLAGKDRELAEKQRLAMALTRQIQKKTQEYQDLQTRLTTVQTQRDQAQRELGTVNRRLRMIAVEYQQVQAAYAQAETALVGTRVELAQAEKQVRELKEQIAPLKAQLEKLENERIRLNRERQRLLADIELLEKEKRQFQAGLESMAFGTVVYRADEIVAATVIEGGQGVSKIQQELGAFLAQANQDAVARGAQIAGKEGVAIKLLEGNFDTAAAIINKAQAPVVVRLLSMTNVVRGEPILAYLQILPHAKIFTAGQVIAERQIDGGQTQEAIQTELMLLLFQVNQTAIQHGMVADRTGKVGDIGIGALQQAIETITAASGPVTVRAVAAEEVWTTKLPLKLRLEVVDGEGSKREGK